MNDFDRDNNWQRNIRDNVLAPSLYAKRAKEGRYVFLDKGKLSTLLQKRYAVDTFLQRKDGSAISIEEKIVRWPGYIYKSYFLETKSCTIPPRESDGWMVYGQADILLYCFEQENNNLLCHFIDFPLLKEWFWKNYTKFPVFKMEKTINKSEGRKVDIEVIKKELGIKIALLSR